MRNLVAVGFALVLAALLANAAVSLWSVERPLDGNARVALLSGTVLSVGLLALAYALLRRDRKRKRRAVADVQREKEWLRVTLQGIGDGVIAADEHGRVRFLNPVARQLTGWSEEDAVGKPVFEIFQIINERTRLPIENPLERVLREGVVVGLANHTVLIARDGLGRGSEFTFRLPLADGPPIPAKAAGPSPAPTGRRKVLIIEDNRDAAEGPRGRIR